MGSLQDVRAWLDDDPDPLTRAELVLLLERVGAGDAAAAADLADRFAGPLQFGTAGLRGALGAGPNRMNRAVVIRAAAGLAAYLRSTGGESVVVGFDARHRSDEFARDTCAVLVAAGLRALVLPRPLPTPVLAFAVRHLGCAAGVMVTASHNPPQDNGYKVYLGDGAQLVPPADAAISAAIDRVGAVRDVPRASEGWRVLADEDVLAPYLSRVASVVRVDGPRDLRVVLTSLHGVGGEVVVEALQRAGFAPPLVVPEQAAPDPDFPTVAFPNPEEPGAIDLALSLAERSDADLVIANDPDADRCAVAAPFPGSSGSWRMLTGDEVGWLLAEHLAERGERGTYACSIVSSTLLQRIAARHDLPYAETLTGFKWISRAPGLRFGYEEALGYCVDPAAVRDKDGVSAALLVCELAARLRAAGSSLAERLDEIARTYGVHATSQVSVRVADLSRIASLMASLRSAPPTSLGGLAVEQVDDLLVPADDLPPTDGLRLRLAESARVVVRPSGTEPKLKAYLEVVVPVADDLPASRATAAARLAAIASDLRGVFGLS